MWLDSPSKSQRERGVPVEEKYKREENLSPQEIIIIEMLEWWDRGSFNWERS